MNEENAPLIFLDDYQYHEDSAGSKNKAITHIAAVYLFAANKGIVSKNHQITLIQNNPAEYALNNSGKISHHDFNKLGEMFIKEFYDDTIEAVEEHAFELNVNFYDFVSSKEGWDYLQLCLEEAWQEFNE